MARLPFDPSKTIQVWRRASAQAALPAGITLAGEPVLVAAAQQRLSEGGTRPATWVRPLSELGHFVSVPGELLLVFVSPAGEEEVIAAIRTARPRGGAVVCVEEGQAATGRVSPVAARCRRLSFADNERGWSRLFSLCVHLAGENAIALARRYPPLRASAARSVVRRTALENGLVGAAFFLSGPDMPVMTLNQLRMVLSLAVIYGEQIDRERVSEAALVLAMGVGARGLTRSLLQRCAGGRWAVRAAVGCTVTLALGFAAIRYYESGAPASSSRLMAMANSIRR